MLTRAEKVIDVYANALQTDATPSQTRQIDLANYTRCTAGAFFNIAGTLYKVEKYGLAIRFLTRACPLAERAMELHDQVTSDQSSPKGKEKEKCAPPNDEKDADVWSNHKSQIYKRWELLGVCYLKLPDRKVMNKVQYFLC